MKGATLYQRLGWRLIPLHSVGADGACACQRGASCTSPGKHPRLVDWPASASADPKQHARWGEEFSGCNIGVATGRASGFIVLDVDPRHGGDESLARLETQHGPLPRTAVQRTGSGGRHFLFKAPDFLVTNSAGRLGPGLDIRGSGGQIVLAPSRSGAGPYTWIHAPWETPLAPAPAWLLAELGRAPQGSTAPTDRGYFAPASAAVLEAAHAVLQAHGPAVDGDGGGLHTVHAAAILTHDFALTEDEAWPIFEAWNRTCVPPWELGELRVMLGRGLKYGKLPYGCRRSLGAVEAARKLIADWQAGPNPGEAMFALIDEVRPLAAKSGDSAKHDVIARELAAATGVSVRALGLPKPAAPTAPTKQGEIRVTTETAKVADESLTAITPHVFARNGVLCEVVKAERTFISDLEIARVRDLMSRHSVYVRQDKTEGVVTMAAPTDVAAIIHARRTLPGVRVLEAITSAPVFLADGTILQQRGYNAQARVFLEPDVAVDLPENPTREDARAAVALLRDLLSDFRFLSRADFSSWLAALLSPLVKAATGNAPAPLICISASTAGAGKSLLAELIAVIITGGAAEIRPYNPRDEAEWGKRLTAFIKAASPVSVFDNVNGEIGDAGLDKLITSSTWSDRLLGASEAPPLPNVTTWLATGNNIEPRGDTVRRVLVVRVEVTTERPQTRTGFKRPLLREYARTHRAELLSAALTVLRAFHVACRPEQGLPAWGNFEVWSGLVREALVWTGCADPFETQARATAELHEPENEVHDFWFSVVSAGDGLTNSIAVLANQRGARELLGLREDLTTYHLRRFIGRFIDKPRGGRRIRRVRDGEQTRYRVEVV